MDKYVSGAIVTDDHVIINQKLEKYRGEFGAYKPEFKGHYENEYPNKWYDWVLQILVLFPGLICAGLLMWGFLAWGFADPYSFGWVSFGVFVGYLVLLNILVFVFGRDRRKRERECIAAKYKENALRREQKRQEAEINAKLLREYQKAKMGELTDEDQAF